MNITSPPPCFGDYLRYEGGGKVLAALETRVTAPLETLVPLRLTVKVVAVERVLEMVY